MRWEDAVLGVVEDLEQQASGLHLAERDAEVADLGAAEFSAVSWASRLHASPGAQVDLRLRGGRRLSGRLARVGEDWLLLDDAAGNAWVVRFAAVATAAGLSPRSVGDAARSVLTRLPLSSVLRHLGDARADCVLHLDDGATLEGGLGRVGADFVEVHGPGPEPALVRLAAIALVQERP
jgi:hypothetical protein